MRSPKAFTFLVCLALAFATSLSARESAPDWLAAAAAAPAGVPAGDAAAVVLLETDTLDVARDGAFTMRIRYAVRVLTSGGAKHAVAQIPYATGASEVKSLKAWLVRPGGGVTAYAKRDILDLARFGTAKELYGEARQQVIMAKDDAVPGAVFGFEAVVTDRSIIKQRAWSFQGHLPVESSSITVTLPPGWRVEGHTFNHAPIEPLVKGMSRTWELKALAALPSAKDEPMRPADWEVTPWLALDIIPPDGKNGGKNVAFESWRSISTFLTPRYDAAAKWDEAIKGHADKLTASAPTPWERIRTLCRYAQQVNYISISLDPANAGGLIPRPATRVFHCNYGDCKDKATLLRSLLASQGIEAYPLIVQGGGHAKIRTGWPSPYQFNHCILAIKVDDTVDVPSLITHPELGRLVVFDATDEFTPPGLVADKWLADQGLLLAAERGGLVALPTLPSSANRCERRVTARIDLRGNVQGTIEDNYFGLDSTFSRVERRHYNQTEFQRRIDRWLAATLQAPRTTRVEARDFFDDARFTLEIDFSSAGYGKMMRDQLLVFKPFMISRRDATLLRKGSRTFPVVIKSSNFTEHSEVVLPEGYEVDEGLVPVKLEAPFGTYNACATLMEGKLVLKRSLELRAAEIPPADYEKVHAFFEKIMQSEQAPVVLRRLPLPEPKAAQLQVSER